MPRRTPGFNIKVAVGLIVLGVAVVTYIWMTRQMEPAFEPTTAQFQSTTVIPGQLDELRAPLPEVTVTSRQETPMDSVAKRKQDPFAPDWAISPKKDEKDEEDAGELVQVARVDVQTEKADPGSDEDLCQPPEESHEISALLTLSLTNEDFARDIKSLDEKADTEASHVVDDESKEELREMERSFNVPVGEQMEPRNEVPTIEWHLNGDAAGDDSLQKYESKPPVDPPRLYVTGIITTEDTSYAIVRTSTSSIIVQPGDEIQGATVKSVDEEAVIVIKQDEEFVLELGGGGKP